jgi:hypothetical protein
LAVVLIALVLLRVALNLFLVFVLLLLLALGGSYLFLGEERTERALEEGLEQIQSQPEGAPAPGSDADAANDPGSRDEAGGGAAAPRTPR